MNASWDRGRPTPAPLAAALLGPFVALAALSVADVWVVRRSAARAAGLRVPGVVVPSRFANVVEGAGTNPYVRVTLWDLILRLPPGAALAPNCAEQNIAVAALLPAAAAVLFAARYAFFRSRG
jgi:hypothetical protein